MGTDFNKPICTRDGRRARILSGCQKPTTNHQYLYPIRVAVELHDGHGWVDRRYTVDGRWRTDGTLNENDLINEMPWHRWLQTLIDNKFHRGHNA